MKRLLAAACWVLAMALLAQVSDAQVRGTPAPDSHQGPAKSSIVPARRAGQAGVRPTPIGVPPAPAPGFPSPTPIGVPPTPPVPGTNTGFHRHHHQEFFGGAYPVYIPVPVVVEPAPMYEPAPEETDDQAVVPGPTVFERRTVSDMTGAAAENAEPPVAAPEPAPAPEAPAVTDSSSADAQPEPPQPASVLVFRDGHQLEIENYAIVGDTLYDFTPGHARKVPLSQLDLNATVKANDDRGLDFSLPASARP